MNRYLTKLAQMYDQDDPADHPLRTATTESIASIPADIAGTAAGAALGSKILKNPMVNFGKTFGEHNIGGMVGAAAGGLLTNYAVLKYQQNKRNQQ